MWALRQIRCKRANICSKQGSKIIVTDLNKSNETGFVLSEIALAAMGQKGHEEDVKKLGIADVEYKRHAQVSSSLVNPVFLMSLLDY